MLQETTPPVEAGKLPNPYSLHMKLSYIQDLQLVILIFVFVQNKFVYIL